jgi:DNA-binding XRE family transcriptional regulator
VFGTDQTARQFTRDGVTAATLPECVIYTVHEVHAAHAPSSSFSDFEELVAGLEVEKESASALAEGRKWVAQRFYGDRSTVAALRLAAGLSQKQLGEKCGIEQPHVSRYESGRIEPSLTTAQCLANALGVGLDEFFAAWSNSRAVAKTEASK